MNEPVRVRLRGAGDRRGICAPAPVMEHLPLEGGMDLRVHEGAGALDALERLEGSWRSLTAESDAPFLTYAWNQAWYHLFSGCGHRPVIFELVCGGRTEAILPCYLEGRTVRLAGDRLCDYQDVIASDDVAASRLVAGAMEWMTSRGQGGHFRFERLSCEGRLFRILHGGHGLPQASLRFEKTFAPCPITSLRGGLEGYLAGLPRRTRQDFRHSLNRLQREAPDARITILRDYEIQVSDLWGAAAFHTACFRKAGESPFRDHRLIDLLGRVAKDPEVGFQLGALTLHGDFLAVDFGFARGGCYYGYLTSFDANFSRWAPGKCLLLGRIDDWVAVDGVERLDFLCGDEAYKFSHTGGEAYEVWSIRLIPDGLVGRVRLAGLESNRRLRQFAKRVLLRDEGLPR